MTLCDVCAAEGYPYDEETCKNCEYNPNVEIIHYMRRRKMYECEKCHAPVKIPAILSVALPQSKDKGIVIEYTFNQYNICLNCARNILPELPKESDAE